MDWFERGMLAQKSKLKSQAMNLYRNPDDADDAVQAVFERALEKRHLFEEGTNLGGWLNTIMFNMFRSRVRRGRAHRLQFTDDPHYADHLHAREDQHKTLEAKQALDMTERLPESQRNLLIATTIGHSITDKATMFRMALGTIKSQTHRAQQKMVELMGGTQ